MKKLVSGLMLGTVLLAGSAAPAFAEQGHTPVSYCHNGEFKTTDDDGAVNGHKTGRGIHANDVFTEDLGREVTPADCKGPVAPPAQPADGRTTEYPAPVIDCAAGLKVVTSITSIIRYRLDVEENVYVPLPAEVISTGQATQPTTAEDCPPVIPPHGEPAPPTTDPVTPEPVTPEPSTPEPVVETYPAPPVTPNTVNGTPVAPVEPAPSGVAAAADVSTGPESSQLANTGANWIGLWAAVGFFALIAGIVSVVLVRRNA